MILRRTILTIFIVSLILTQAICPGYALRPMAMGNSNETFSITVNDGGIYRQAISAKNRLVFRHITDGQAIDRIEGGYILCPISDLKVEHEQIERQTGRKFDILGLYQLSIFLGELRGNLRYYGHGDFECAGRLYRLPDSTGAGAYILGFKVAQNALDSEESWDKIRRNLQGYAVFGEDYLSDVKRADSPRKKGVHFNNSGAGFNALGRLMKMTSVVVEYERAGHGLQVKIWVKLDPLFKDEPLVNSGTTLKTSATGDIGYSHFSVFFNKIYRSGFPGRRPKPFSVGQLRNRIWVRRGKKKVRVGVREAEDAIRKLLMAGLIIKEGSGDKTRYRAAIDISYSAIVDELQTALSFLPADAPMGEVQRTVVSVVEANGGKAYIQSGPANAPSVVIELPDYLRYLAFKIKANLGTVPKRYKGRALLKLSAADLEAIGMATDITTEQRRCIQDALLFVQKQLWDRTKITEADIFEIQRILLNAEYPPSYRRHEIREFVHEKDEFGDRVVTLGTTLFSPADSIPGRMKSFIEFFNEVMSHRRRGAKPLLVAADIYKRFIQIHPFVDFNAREASILAKLYLAHQGYPGFVGVAVRKSDEIRVKDLAVIFGEMMLATSEDMCFANSHGAASSFKTASTGDGYEKAMQRRTGQIYNFNNFLINGSSRIIVPANESGSNRPDEIGLDSPIHTPLDDGSEVISWCSAIYDPYDDADDFGTSFLHDNVYYPNIIFPAQRTIELGEGNVIVTRNGYAFTTGKWPLAGCVLVIIQAFDGNRPIAYSAAHLSRTFHISALEKNSMIFDSHPLMAAVDLLKRVVGQESHSVRYHGMVIGRKGRAVAGKGDDVVTVKDALKRIWNIDVGDESFYEAEKETEAVFVTYDGSSTARAEDLEKIVGDARDMVNVSNITDLRWPSSLNTALHAGGVAKAASTGEGFKPSSLQAKIRDRALSCYSDELAGIGRDHVQRVTEMAMLFAREDRDPSVTPLTEEQLDILWKAGLYHDIGREGADMELRQRTRAFADRYDIAILHEDKYAFLKRFGGQGVDNIVGLFEASVIDEVNKRFGSLSADSQGEFKKYAQAAGFGIEDRPDGCIFAISEGLHNNIAAFFDHEGRSAQLLKEGNLETGFEATDELLAIVANHSDPRGVSLEYPAWVRQATEYLYAADVFETRCNQAKQSITRKKKTWPRVSLGDPGPGALPILKRRAGRGMIRESLYRMVEDMVFDQHPALKRLVLDAMEVSDWHDYDGEFLADRVNIESAPKTAVTGAVSSAVMGEVLHLNCVVTAIGSAA